MLPAAQTSMAWPPLYFQPWHIQPGSGLLCIFSLGKAKVGVAGHEPRNSEEAVHGDREC